MKSLPLAAVTSQLPFSLEPPDGRMAGEAYLGLTGGEGRLVSGRLYSPAMAPR